MMISKDRMDRFTSDAGDFEIIKPAPDDPTEAEILITLPEKLE